VRAERRRHVAKKVPTGRATAVVSNGACRVHPQPVAARFARRIDALHRQAGQVLHRFSSKATKLGPSRRDMLPWPACSEARLYTLLRPVTAAHARNYRRPSCSPRSREPESAWPEHPWPEATDPGPRGNSALDGAHFALSKVWCQEENTTRYCGKVAAVQNVVSPRGVSGPKAGTPRARCSKEPRNAPGNQVAHFCVVKNEEGGAALLQFDEAQDGGRNAQSNKI